MSFLTQKKKLVPTNNASALVITRPWRSDTVTFTVVTKNGEHSADFFVSDLRNSLETHQEMTDVADGRIVWGWGMLEAQVYASGGWLAYVRGGQFRSAVEAILK